MEKLCVGWRLRVLKFWFFLVLFSCQVWLQHLSKIFDFWSSCCLVLHSSCYLGSPPFSESFISNGKLGGGATVFQEGHDSVTRETCIPTSLNVNNLGKPPVLNFASGSLCVWCHANSACRSLSTTVLITSSHRLLIICFPYLLLNVFLLLWTVLLWNLSISSCTRAKYFWVLTEHWNVLSLAMHIFNCKSECHNNYLLKPTNTHHWFYFLFIFIYIFCCNMTSSIFYFYYHIIFCAGKYIVTFIKVLIIYHS
jgi:hypothetical protein